MPALGKEVEHQLTPDQIATREVEGYIDKIEHQAEAQQPQTQSQQQPQQPPKQISQDMGKTVSGQFANTAKQKIKLPLNQAGVELGLKGSVAGGVRWLSEWCVMMIKKYPGRVFYLPPEINK